MQLTYMKTFKAGPDSSTSQKVLISLVSAIISCLKQVEEALISSPLMSADSFPSFKACSDFWANVVNRDVTTYILPYAFPSVIRKLQLSYERSFSELTKNIDKKIKILQRLSFS